MLDFSGRTLVMGIVNATPDSFYPGSRAPVVSKAVGVIKTMIDAGADIIDVGGESTRPGSDSVDAGEERERVVPIIAAVREFSDIPISIDTRKADVAAPALEAGADIINDISGLRDDGEMAPLAAEKGCPVVIMHIRGTPENMQEKPFYYDTLSEVSRELMERVEVATTAGIDPGRIILDPGIGFGKRLEDNLALLKNTDKLKELGYPVLIGLSRKSFIDAVLNVPVEDRLVGSLSAEAFTILKGADIIRVHDVKESVHLVRMLVAIQSA